MFIEILFKILLFKGGVLIYAEHCIYGGHTALLSRSKLPQGKFLHRDSPNATCFATDIAVSNARKFKSVQKLFKVPFIINV